MSIYSYRENAIRMSKLMKDEMMPGKDVAVYWIEYVLRHGETKHLQSRAKNLPFYKIHLLDVWLIFALVLIFTFYINYRILRWIVRKMRKPNKIKSN